MLGEGGLERAVLPLLAGIRGRAGHLLFAVKIPEQRVANQEGGGARVFAWREGMLCDRVIAAMKNVPNCLFYFL